MRFDPLLKSSMVLSIQIMVFELLLIGSFAIDSQANLLIFKKIVSLDAINAHIALNSSLKIEFILFALKILFVDSYTSLAGHFELDIFRFAYLFCADYVEKILPLLWQYSALLAIRYFIQAQYPQLLFDSQGDCLRIWFQYIFGLVSLYLLRHFADSFRLYLCIRRIIKQNIQQIQLQIGQFKQKIEQKHFRQALFQRQQTNPSLFQKQSQKITFQKKAQNNPKYHAQSAIIILNFTTQTIIIIRNFLFKRMQTKVFNVLIIGRSGSGKSATTKLLTSNPAIKVANSLKEVTTDVNFYQGSSFEVTGQEVRFRILDIPGLDKITNRVDIRQKILRKLEQHQVSLHAIIYVSSLTERDTIDGHKLFNFLQQLPWSVQHKKNSLIPVLTKYDNLVIDAQEEEIAATKQQFHEIFQKAGYGVAWAKRIYWINQTKSLEFKIKSYEEIRQKYEKQVQRLVFMIKKNKMQLTATAIREIIEQEDKFILKKLFGLLTTSQLEFKKQKKAHNVLLKVQVQPQTFQESITTVSASSIGIFISKVCQKQVSQSFSIILMSVPIAIALLKLATDCFVYRDKTIGQNSSGQLIMQSYEHICKQINNQMQREWKQINQDLQFSVVESYLRCCVLSRHYKFFQLSSMDISFQDEYFQKSKENNHIAFILKMPKFKEEMVWTPVMTVEYQIKKINQESVLKYIEAFRKEFCSHI